MKRIRENPIWMNPVKKKIITSWEFEAGSKNKVGKLITAKPLIIGRIKSIEPYGYADVYDIEVEDTHNFVANGIIVHNCETLELLPLMDYLLIVTIPSTLSKSKVERMIEAAREFQIPILGVIKNMSYFECPSCGSRYRIFMEDHSFEELGIPTIVEFPLNPKFASEKFINEFPVEAILDALKHPTILRRRTKSLRRKLLELILKVKGGSDALRENHN